MKPNIELMKRLRMRFLRMKHEEHFQMDVIAVKTYCGSQMCIAGHTLELAGYRRKLRPKYRREAILDYDYFTPSGIKVKKPLVAAAVELGVGNYRRQRNNVAFNLFHDHRLDTPREAAERISELIKEYST